jgi:hypothetical protein
LIDKEIFVKLNALGLTTEQFTAVVMMLVAVADATKEAALEPRRANERARQARWRSKAGGGPEPIVIDGKWNEREWQRRRFIVFERDNWTCVYCGTAVRDNPQCDHVIPVSKGGHSELDNLATACKRCNSGKSGMLLEEWGGPIWGPSQQH